MMVQIHAKINIFNQIPDRMTQDLLEMFMQQQCHVESNWESVAPTMMKPKDHDKKLEVFWQTYMSVAVWRQ